MNAAIVTRRLLQNLLFFYYEKILIMYDNTDVMIDYSYSRLITWYEWQMMTYYSFCFRYRKMM